MSKNYKHQPPPQRPSKLEQENAALKSENNRLEMALKLMTGEDKQKLLDAIKIVEGQEQATQWFTLDTNQPITVTGTTILTVGTTAI